MSKVAATAGIGATGAILGVGGAYILGAFGKPMSLEIPVSLEELKKGGDKSVVGVYFPGLTLAANSEGEAWGGEDKKPADDFLKGTNANGGISHLLVNWEKFACSASSTDKTWTGRMRWLWAFSHNDKGFLMYLNATPSSTEDGKLSVEGIIYALSREEKDKGWTVKYHKKTNDNLTVDSSNNKLPVPNDKLKIKDHWGFLDTTDALGKMCKRENPQTDEAKNKPTKEFKGAWVWEHKEGGQDKLMDWSKKDGNDYQWLNTFFGTLTPKFEDLTKDFSGTWKLGGLVNGELAQSASGK